MFIEGDTSQLDICRCKCIRQYWTCITLRDWVRYCLPVFQGQPVSVKVIHSPVVCARNICHMCTPYMCKNMSSYVHAIYVREHVMCTLYMCENMSCARYICARTCHMWRNASYTVVPSCGVSPCYLLLDSCLGTPWNQ